MSETTTAKKHPIRERFCGLMLELREHHVFIAGTLIASLISALSFCPYYPVLVDADGNAYQWTIIIRVVSMVLIPLFAAADKTADVQAKADAKSDANEASQEAQKAYRQSISSLLLIANWGAGIAKDPPSRKKTLLKDLRTVSVAATHGLSIAPQTRATYYTLKTTADGRVLGEPVSHGRVEESTTIWEEAKDPAHSVWGIMDGEDVNAPIVRSTDEDKKDWADWDNKRYKSFISVPVKAGGVQFGLLSLNAPKSEDLTETDRMAVLVAARIMATTLSLAHEPPALKELEDSLDRLRSDRAAGLGSVDSSMANR
ncbi:hypothetical protein [Arthrobacter sp. 08Y14]|uniref:hypothetical protein n=1 Tax=Arthrobacter sp. 08Y14 TaxID=2058885 RepID=UPI0011B03256|nr:hypothetical protein [Arthrobacter sp. 08Y14]